MQSPLQVETAPERNQEEGIKDERTGKTDQETAEDRAAVDRHGEDQEHSRQDVFEAPRHLVHMGEKEIDHRRGKPHLEVPKMTMTDRNQSPDNAELGQQDERDQEELVERGSRIVPRVRIGGMGSVVVLDRRAAGRRGGTGSVGLAQLGAEFHRYRAERERLVPAGESDRRGVRNRRSGQTRLNFILNVV